MLSLDLERSVVVKIFCMRCKFPPHAFRMRKSLLLYILYTLRAFVCVTRSFYLNFMCARVVAKCARLLCIMRGESIFEIRTHTFGAALEYVIKGFYVCTLKVRKMFLKVFSIYRICFWIIARAKFLFLLKHFFVR